jgi:hypothetical protein
VCKKITLSSRMHAHIYDYARSKVAGTHGTLLTRSSLHQFDVYYNVLVLYNIYTSYTPNSFDFVEVFVRARRLRVFDIFAKRSTTIYTYLHILVGCIVGGVCAVVTASKTRKLRHTHVRILL